MKGKIVKIKHNAVVAALIDPDRPVRLFANEALSYKVSGAEQSSAFANGSWDGHSSLFKMNNNSFPAGFVRYLKKKLEGQGAKVQVYSSPVPEPLGPESPQVDTYPENSDYSYQLDTARRLVSLRAMIAQIATGGGKSRVFKLACARIGRSTLFITTRKTLMYQMAEQMGDQSKPIGMLGDGVWNPEPSGINFAIVDTLVSRLEKKSVDKEIDKQLESIEKEADRVVLEIFKKKNLPTTDAAIKMAPKDIRNQINEYRDKIVKKVREKYPAEAINAKAVKVVERQAARRRETIELLRQIEFVTIEEAHEVSGNGFYDILNQCHNAHYRLALTATPFMKDDEEANMRLMAVTGPIGIQVTEKYLIEKGILATPHFHYFKAIKPPKLNRGTPWQSAYARGIVENEHRNSIIVSEAKRASSYGLPVMCLVQHTNHGRRLLKLFKESGMRAEFISGEDNQEKRQKALNELGSGKISALIGSTILDVGVDVPAVGFVALGGGGKAEVAIRQRIGRGLRSKSEGPNVCFIIDFMDTDNKHLWAHAKLRKEVITSTPGFAENIHDRPFNYEEFGLTIQR